MTPGGGGGQRAFFFFPFLPPFCLRSGIVYNEEGQLMVVSGKKKGIAKTRSPGRNFYSYIILFLRARNYDHYESAIDRTHQPCKRIEE